MKFQGRRVAMLLTGAFPLLAEDAIVERHNLVDMQQQQQQQQQQQRPITNGVVVDNDSRRRDYDDDDENDVHDMPLTASERIHSDTFHLPPLPTNLLYTPQTPPPPPPAPPPRQQQQQQQQQEEGDSTSNAADTLSSTTSSRAKLQSTGTQQLETENHEGSVISDVDGNIDDDGGGGDTFDIGDEIVVEESSNKILPRSTRIEVENDHHHHHYYHQQPPESSDVLDTVTSMMGQIWDKVAYVDSKGGGNEIEPHHHVDKDNDDGESIDELSDDNISGDLDGKNSPSLKDDEPAGIAIHQQDVILETVTSVVGQLWDRVGYADSKEETVDTLMESNDYRNETKFRAEEEIVDRSKEIEPPVADEASDASSAGNELTNIDEVNTDVSSLGDDEDTQVEPRTQADVEDESADEEHAIDDAAVGQQGSGIHQEASEAEGNSNKDTAVDRQGSEIDHKPSDDDDENLTKRVAVDYASKSAGALIIEKSSSIKGTSNLLTGDMDQYAIAPCEDKKFVVIGLSEDILVKQVKLSNYERFSSRVKDFQVLGSQTMGKWIELGTYTAKPGNGEQTFDLVEPAWARYLKFKFLSHHGSEYYCTLSQIKVHGSTMLQGFHEQWEENEDEKESSDVTIQDAQKDRTSTAQENLAEDETVVESGENTDLEEADENTNDASTCEENSDLGRCPPVGTNLPGLERFQESQSLTHRLRGHPSEELLGTMSDLIPQVRRSLPVESVRSPGRRNESEIRTLQRIGNAAVESFFWSSQVASEAAKTLVTERSSMSIDIPKMSDALDDVVRRFKDTATGRQLAITPKPPTKSNDERSAEARESEDAEKPKTNSDQVDAQQHNDQIKEARTHELELGKESLSDESMGSLPDTSAPTTEKPTEIIETSAMDPSSREVDLSLARMLERLPSADCLQGLDYADFKTRVFATRKTTSGGNSAAGGGEKEPIFKKLTDEIKSLQLSLSAHDQFTKASVACYQRVLIDLVTETQALRSGHEDRLLKLEEEILRARNSNLVSILSSWVWGCLSLLFSFGNALINSLISTIITESSILPISVLQNLTDPMLSSFGRLRDWFAGSDAGDSIPAHLKWIAPLFPVVSLLVFFRQRALTSRTNTATGPESAKEDLPPSSVQDGAEGKTEDDVPSLIDEDSHSTAGSNLQKTSWLGEKNVSCRESRPDT